MLCEESGTVIVAGEQLSLVRKTTGRAYVDTGKMQMKTDKT